MRQPYPSDLSDSQWELLADFFAEAETGRPREVDICAVVDAIFYVNRTGVQWRYLPHDYPRWDGLCNVIPKSSKLAKVGSYPYYLTCHSQELRCKALGCGVFLFSQVG